MPRARDGTPHAQALHSVDKGATVDGDPHRPSLSCRILPMDADRFDTLSRSLSTTPSRRGALRVLAGSLLGGLITLGAEDGDAHDPLKKCKKKSGKQKK